MVSEMPKIQPYEKGKAETSLKVWPWLMMLCKAEPCGDARSDFESSVAS